MRCGDFHAWLENRDMCDLSESDRAMRHSAECDACRELLGMDEVLDRVIARGMECEKLPEQLERIVTLNLGGVPSRRRRLPAAMIRLVSLAAGLAAVVALFLVFPVGSPAIDDFGKALVKDQAMHDYAHDFDKITSLPGWLAEHSDFRLTLPKKFNNSGLELVGGLICIVADCRTVHLVYRDNDAFVSLFIIDAGQMPAVMDEGRTYTVTVKDHHVKMWKDGRQVFAVVS